MVMWGDMDDDPALKVHLMGRIFAKAAHAKRSTAVNKINHLALKHGDHDSDKEHMMNSLRHVGDARH